MHTLKQIDTGERDTQEMFCKSMAWFHNNHRDLDLSVAHEAIGVLKAREKTRAGWTLQMDSLLGTKEDHEIAMLLGVHKITVIRRRMALGIQAFTQHGVEWTPERDCLIGTKPDAQVAKELGINTSLVIRRRRHLKIKPRGFNTFHWTDEAEALLGTAPDSAIARRLGTGTHHVERRRRKLQIPPYRVARLR